MLNDATSTAAMPAVVREHGGEVDRLVGDALVATFNRRGDQPDHARARRRRRRARDQSPAAVAAAHPAGRASASGSTRARCAVGSSAARRGRTHTVVGDAVNVAARLQAAAPPSGVVVGATTLGAACPAPRATALGELVVKGRRRAGGGPPARGARRAGLALAAQRRAPDLAARGLRQLGREVDDARVLVGRGLALDVLLQLARERRRAGSWPSRSTTTARTTAPRSSSGAATAAASATAGCATSADSTSNGPIR